MNQFHSPSRCSTLLLALSLGLLAASPSQAQVMQLPPLLDPPSFQAKTGASYQTLLLSRLALSGEYSADDIVPLLRLVVLETRAMFAALDTDRGGSPLGAMMGGQTQAFWIASGDIDEQLRAGAADALGPVGVRLLFREATAAYQQVLSTLGEFPGASPRAAENLAEVALVIDAADRALTAAGIGDEVLQGPIAGSAFDLDGFKRQTTEAANAMTALIGLIDGRDLDPRYRPDLVRRFSDLVAIVGELTGSFVQIPDPSLAQPMLDAVGRRMMQLEPQLSRLARAFGLESAWSAARDRMAALAPTANPPRILELPREPQAVPPRPAPRASGGRATTAIYRSAAAAPGAGYEAAALERTPAPASEPAVPPRRTDSEPAGAARSSTRIYRGSPVP
jgi:hypothetical protein